MKNRFKQAVIVFGLGLMVLAGVASPALADEATSTQPIHPSGHRRGLIIGENWVIENPGGVFSTVDFSITTPEQKRVNVLWLKEEIAELSARLAAMQAAGQN